MTVRMRHTKSHTANRRSHHAISGTALSKCDHCGAMRMNHRACASCGFYKGRAVIDVRAKVEKAQKKEKAKAAEQAGQK